MSLLIRTSEVPEKQRRDAWRTIICDTLGPLDMRSDPDVPLEGELHAGHLGQLTVGHICTSTPHSVHRTPRLIRRDDPELYRVVMPINGNLLLSQQDRQIRLDSGEFAIYDFSQPYELANDRPVQLAVFGFSRELLSLPVDSVARTIAHPLGAGGGSAALIGPLLHRITLDMETYPPTSAARLSTVVLDLLSTAVAEHAEAGLPVEQRERMMLTCIHAYIEEHLPQTDLTPGVLAEAHQISLRSLHRLFAAEQNTAASWIRQRRLERCRRDLSDPSKLGVPVSNIAARWGLTDAAHFNRLFRHAYGLPPAEYRHLNRTSTT